MLPTRTWQAQNQRDDDGDGHGDTWDATPGLERVQLGRPFEHRGVPPGFRHDDLGFLQWLHDTGRGVDVLAQEDLDDAAGAELATAYDLILFPGRHVYVTEAESTPSRRSGTWVGTSCSSRPTASPGGSTLDGA